MLDKSKKTEEKSVIEQQKNLLNYIKKSAKKSDYMTDTTGVEKMNFQDFEAKLENDVVSQLKSEFPGIEKTKSFALLVDAVVNNIKNKDIKISDKRSM